MPADSTTIGVVPGAGVVFASAARTATVAGAEFSPPPGTVGLTFRIDVSAIAATPSVTFTVQGWDQTAEGGVGEWFDILTSAAIVATGSTILKVDPRITAAANTVAQHAVVPRMRVNAVHGDADSITYSVTVFASG